MFIVLVDSFFEYLFFAIFIIFYKKVEQSWLKSLLQFQSQFVIFSRHSVSKGNMRILSALYNGFFSFWQNRNKGTVKEAKWKTYENKDDKRKIELNSETIYGKNKQYIYWKSSSQLQISKPRLYSVPNKTVGKSKQTALPPPPPIHTHTHTHIPNTNNREI